MGRMVRVWTTDGTVSTSGEGLEGIRTYPDSFYYHMCNSVVAFFFSFLSKSAIGQLSVDCLLYADMVQDILLISIWILAANFSNKSSVRIHHVTPSNPLPL